MRFRSAALIAVTVPATLLAIPVSTAHAVAPVERLWSFGDADADGKYELGYRDLPGGAFTAVPNSPAGSYLAGSRDGTRITYLRSNPKEFADEVVVRDISTRQVAIPHSLPTFDQAVYSPQLSPDGTRVAWTDQNFDAYTPPYGSVQDVVPTSEFPERSGCYDCSISTFLDSTTVLANGWAIPTVDEPDRPTTTVTGLVGGVATATVSPDGHRIAWSDYPQLANPRTTTLRAGLLTRASDGTWSVTDVRVIATGLNNHEPSFSRDSQSVYWTQDDGTYNSIPSSTILVRPYDASSPPTTVGPGFGAAVTQVPANDTTPTASSWSRGATLLGTSATLHWQVPGERDLSGVVIIRQLGQTVQKSVYVPAPLSSWTDTGLVLGQTYTYRFGAVDRANNYAPEATRNLTALKAAPSASDPTTNVSANETFPVTLGPTDAGAGTYQLTWMPSYTTQWRGYIVSKSRVVTFGGPAPGWTKTGVQGTTYLFRVTVEDNYGNASLPATSTRVVLPLDQKRAVLSGGTDVVSSTAFMGSYRRLSRTSDYARISLTGDRFQLIGWRCASCGKVDVLEDGRLIATVDTYASSSQARRVLYTRSLSQAASHTYTIRPRGTSGRPYVLLDAFAMRQPVAR